MPIHGHSREAISQNIREMIASGHPHAQAVAAALNTARRYWGGGGIAARDLGGQVDPSQDSSVGGIAPSIQSMNPVTRGLVQRYAALPPEKLQELAAMSGGSQQGQIIRQVLQQKLSQPQAPQQQGAPQPGIAPQAPQPPQVARGGLVPHLAAGGDPMGISSSAADPWFERQEAYGSERPMAGGFLAGSTPGRADSIRTQAPGGSYVLPADVVAGLGEGNSLAGARIAQEMFAAGPHGIPEPRGARGRGPPQAPRPLPMGEAKGGGVQRGPLAGTPVALSHGEFVVHPAVVTKIGGGNLMRGHRVLDKFVVNERAKQIAKLKKLPGPVKS